MRFLGCRSSVSPARLAAPVLALIAGAVLPHTVAAQEIRAAVGGVSDYVVHGVTRSRNDPAGQGVVSVSGSRGTAAGIWVSTVNLNPGPGANAEYAPFVSQRFRFNIDLALDAKIARYFYPDDPSQLDYDYTELRAALVYRDSIELSMAYSPDWSMYTRYGPTTDRRAIWTELSATYPVDRYVSLTGGVGYADLSDHDRSDYAYFSAGMEWHWRRLLVGLSYVGTNNDGKRLFSSDNAGNRVVGSLIWVIR